jgi:hypothetical protein
MTDTPTELPVHILTTAANTEEPDLSQMLGQLSTPEKPAQPAKGKNRFFAAQPVLERLFELYPNLFGQRFLPLKLGVYQDLLAAHPDVFKRDDLKLALGVHTRSTRYLQSVAAGLPRHDLQGQVVESVAPEHVLLSIVEVFTRRQARSAEDLLPKLQNQLVAAYEKSGLARADYLARIGTLDEVIAAVLDEAISQVDLQRARRAALVKAYETSGKSVEEFADMFGMELREVKATMAAHQKNTE